MIIDIVSRYRLKRAIYIGDIVGDKNASGIAEVDFGYVSYGFGSIEDQIVSFGSFE